MTVAEKKETRISKQECVRGIKRIKFVKRYVHVVDMRCGPGV